MSLRSYLFHEYLYAKGSRRNSNYYSTIVILMKEKIIGIFNRKEKVYVALIFLTILFDIPFLKFNVLLSGDEFSMLLVPAYFAGMDWTDFVGIYSFHGYGLTILLSPLFMLFKHNLYQIYLLENLFIRCGLPCLTYKILEELNPKNKNNFWIASLCCISTLGSFAGVLASGVENAVAFFFLLTCYFLLKLFKTNKNKYLLFIFVICAYMITIHSRVVIFYGSLFFIALLFFWNNKKSLKKVISKKCILILLCSLGLIILFNAFNDAILVKFYSSSKEIPNTVASMNPSYTVPVFINFLLSNTLETLKTFIALFVSFGYYSFGLFYIWVIFLIMDILDCVKKKVYTPKAYVEIYGLTALFLMNALYSLKGARNIVLNQDYKPYTFVRYSLPFCWIIMALGLSFMFEKVKKSQIPFWAFVLFVISAKFYLSYCAKCIQFSTQLTDFKSFLFFKDKSIFEYFGMISIIGIFVLFACILFWKKNSVLIIIMFFCISFLSRISNFTYLESCEDEHYEQIDELCKYIEQNEITESYLLGSEHFYYYLQVKEPDVNFIPLNDIDEFYGNDKKIDIVFTNECVDEVKDNYIFEELDEGEYILYKK